MLFEHKVMDLRIKHLRRQKSSTYWHCHYQSI